jgi:hypothetical protein
MGTCSQGATNVEPELCQFKGVVATSLSFRADGGEKASSGATPIRTRQWCVHGLNNEGSFLLAGLDRMLHTLMPRVHADAASLCKAIEAGRGRKLGGMYKDMEGLCSFLKFFCFSRHVVSFSRLVF